MIKPQEQKILEASTEKISQVILPRFEHWLGSTYKVLGTCDLRILCIVKPEIAQETLLWDKHLGKKKLT